MGTPMDQVRIRSIQKYRAIRTTPFSKMSLVSLVSFGVFWCLLLLRRAARFGTVLYLTKYPLKCLCFVYMQA